MMLPMTAPTPPDETRTLVQTTIAGRDMTVQSLTDLQLMHLNRYANILQKDDVAIRDRLTAAERMFNILHSCILDPGDRQFMVEQEEEGNIKLTDLTTLVTAFRRPAAGGETKTVAVRRGRPRRAS